MSARQHRRASALGGRGPRDAMSRACAFVTALVSLGVMSLPSVVAAERWSLLARHGECAEVETLKRKVPDLGAINDPHAFALFMRGKGYAVVLNPMTLPRGQAYEVRVPEKELFLIFVTAPICSDDRAR